MKFAHHKALAVALHCIHSLLSPLPLSLPALKRKSVSFGERSPSLPFSSRKGIDGRVDLVAEADIGHVNQLRFDFRLGYGPRLPIRVCVAANRPLARLAVLHFKVVKTI